MKLNNSALLELYDTLVGHPTITISPYEESPIDKAFRECDEKLQKDIDIWKCGNEILLSANTDLASYKRKLEKDLDYAVKENEKLREECEQLKASLSYSALQKLQKDLDDAKNQPKYFTNSRDNWRSRAHHAEDEVEALKKDLDGANKQIQTLKEFNSEITSKNVDIASRNVELARKNEHLENRVRYLKKELDVAEKELMELKETFEKANADRTELQNDRDTYNSLYAESKKDYVKLFEENKKLKARTDCLRVEVEWYRKYYKEQSDKIRELKNRLNSMFGTTGDEYIQKLQDGVRDIGYKQGQTDLWNMLIEVGDATTSELCGCFPDVCEVEDILNWDLEDFLDAYKKWQEEKEKHRLDHMRDYLARFCEGRVCEACPLGSNEYKCGCGYSFEKAADCDMKLIPDEELERYYEKAIGFWDGRYILKDGKLFIHDLKHPMAGVNEAIKNACEKFTKAVEAADANIAENLRKGCTIEATVKINKDLLEKVCGIKSDEEEHKLEYGDAVRVPWCDHDYMYIGPEEKHIRLFNPKTHTVVFVAPNENLKYQGCKIVLTSEDDLRKIWKYKK